MPTQLSHDLKNARKAGSSRTQRRANTKSKAARRARKHGK